LFIISIPGLLWLAVFVNTFYAMHNFKWSGPICRDTWDEIAQYKLVYGLISGMCVWFRDGRKMPYRLFELSLLSCGKITLHYMHA